MTTPKVKSTGPAAVVSVAAAVVSVAAGAVVSVLAGAAVVSVLAGAVVAVVAAVVVVVSPPQAAANRATVRTRSTSALQSRARRERDVGIAGCTSHFL